MSERTLKRLVGAAGALIALWIVVTLAAGRDDRAEAAPAELTGWFDGLEAGTVEAVKVDGPTGGVELRPAAAGRWTVNGFAADSGTVARFWTDVAEVKVGGLAARNPSNHDRLGVVEDSARVLEIELGGDTRRLLVGKGGPSYGTAYARLPGRDDVYLLDGDLRPHLSRSEDDWRDKRVVGVDTALVRRLEVRRDGESYAVVRADSVWTVAGGAEADERSVRDVLGELADLRAAGFLTDADSLAGTPEAIRVTALGASGDTLGAVTLGEGEGDRWARARGSETIFRLPSWRVDRLAPGREAVEGGGG